MHGRRTIRCSPVWWLPAPTRHRRGDRSGEGPLARNFVFNATFMWIWLGRRERHKIPASTGTLLLSNEAAFMLLLLGECWSRLHAEIQILWTTIGPATPALVEAERQWRYLVAPRIREIHMSCALHGCRPKANRAFARSATPTYAFLQVAWRTLLGNSGRFRGITWEVELPSELLNRVELHRGDLFQHTLAPNMKPVGDLRLIYTSAK